MEVDHVLKCQHCEENVVLPFRCPFCGGYFCADHRLPENHGCPELWKARIRPPPPVEGRYPPEVRGEPPEKQAPISYPLRFRRAGWTSTTEMLHLAAGALVVMAVGLSMESYGLEWVFRVFSEPGIALVSALAFTFVFVSHELAHKAVAKHYRLWAEFRISMLGAAFTLLSVASPLIKIISPGAVMIAGAANRKIVGMTALAGPLTSIILTCLLLALHFYVPDSSVALMVLRGASLSAWIGIFNLIPFSILDGAKVLWWSKPVWAVSFAVATVLGLVTLQMLALR